MASIINRDGRWRALVRKNGIVKCATFGSRADANAWADRIEREVDQIKATGVISAKGQRLAKLIDRPFRNVASGHAAITPAHRPSGDHSHPVAGTRLSESK